MWVPEVLKSSIKQPEFDQKSPDLKVFEESLPKEAVNDVKMVIDEDDEEITFDNLRSDAPILVTKKRNRQESGKTNHLVTSEF